MMLCLSCAFDLLFLLEQELGMPRMNFWNSSSVRELSLFLGSATVSPDRPEPGHLK